MSSFIIQLHQLRFNANHGLYDEEQRTGNLFEVNLSLTLAAPTEKLTSLQDSINYAEVYHITKKIFEQRQALLETLAMTIAESIKEQFPPLRKIAVQIIKLHPPIASFTGSVSVTYNKEFED